MKDDNRKRLDLFRTPFRLLSPERGRRSFDGSRDFHADRISYKLDQSGQGQFCTNVLRFLAFLALTCKAVSITVAGSLA